MVLQIPIRKYNQIISIGAASARLDQVSRDLTNAVNRGMNITQLGQININLPVLEVINLGYTEKQITGIEEDIIYYSYGVKLPLLSQFYQPPTLLPYPLFRKYFSGDLSGIIGESVFVYYLIHDIGVSPQDIVHLRPQKRRNQLSPDFLIYDRFRNLSIIFESTAYPVEVYAEVKGCMGDIDHERIKKALEQLSRLVRSSNQFGILFVLNRPRMSEYKATLVVVRG